MFRRIICLVIIASMMLHCAARLGALSYLYEKRHEVAFSVGLISEVPIATCSHDYDFGKGLVVHDTGNDHKVQLNFSFAKEIVLFVQNVSTSIVTNWTSFDNEQIEAGQRMYCSTCLLDIFRPPAL